MEFTKSLVKGKLIKRYKRFFTDIKLNNETVTAHCPNTGSMKGLLDENNDVYLLPNNDPKRKLKFRIKETLGDRRRHDSTGMGLTLGNAATWL